jgi:hypothetical protein
MLLIILKILARPPARCQWILRAADLFLIQVKRLSQHGAETPAPFRNLTTDP